MDAGLTSNAPLAALLGREPAEREKLVLNGRVKHKDAPLGPAFAEP